MQQGSEEEGLEGELVVQEQFFMEGEYLMQVVEVVAGNEVLVAGEEILWELEVWREVEVMVGEELVVEEKDHEIQQGTYGEQEWVDEGMEREVAIGEEIFLELEVGMEEEMNAEKELVEKEEHEVQQEEESKEQCREEESLEGEVVSKEQFVDGGEGEVQQGPESEENREDKEVLEGELGAQEQFVLWQEGLTQVVQVVPGHCMWAGEEVFPDLQVGKQEEVVDEELRVKEQTEVLQGPDHQEEGWMEEQLIAGEKFVPKGEGENAMKAMEQVGKAEPQSEAEAKPQEEKPVQQEPAQSGSGGKCTWSPLEVLQALQLEMEPVNEQASRAFSRLRRRTWQRRKPYFELRSLNIGHIPGFWPTAVSLRVEERDHNVHGTVQEKGQFVNHPELSAMISIQDENMLGHMIDLKVREVGHPGDCCTISLCFRSNPYFRNDVIVKEYLITLTGYRLSRATPIQWYQHYEREAYSRRHNDSTFNFFNWFSDHMVAGSGRIAEIISKDLWLNPLKYYE
ncbi:testis-specific Y-encoded protein 1-like, partial [Myotis yumanensis]|uniref:testis-specific Y-encoded protein 1-like n=1 Tax=Myotis yumanensis TaxID=159337 RepID=UPI0038D4E5D2